MDVLRAWQGLGYYSRARRLHGAARLVRERHGGALPPSAEGLRRLPGIGEYTAGAVASIAFGEVVPAVDANVRRVLSRLFDAECGHYIQSAGHATHGDVGVSEPLEEHHVEPQAFGKQRQTWSGCLSLDHWPH